VTGKKENNSLTREDVNEIIQESVNKKVLGIEKKVNSLSDNLKFLIECAQSNDTTTQDNMQALNTLKETIEKQTYVVKDTIDNLIGLGNNLSEAIKSLSQGGYRKQTKPKKDPKTFTIDRVPEAYRNKIKITVENDKVVVRKEGFLGANKTESDARWKELTEILREYAIYWVKGGVPNQDWRWSSK
jgi:hypothetical protein